MRGDRQNILLEFDISYTSKEITPWGGMIFLKQMLQKIGFRELVEQNEDLPQSGYNRGYKTTSIIESFISFLWCGANRFSIMQKKKAMVYWTLELYSGL